MKNPARNPQPQLKRAGARSNKASPYFPRAINSRSSVEKWPRKCTGYFVRVKADARASRVASSRGRPPRRAYRPRTYSARGRGRAARGKRSDRYDLLPAANSVSPAARANRVCVHPSFSLSRLTRRRGTPLFRSAPSFKVTDCLLYYPLASIFTHSSSARWRASEPSRVLASLSLDGDANSSPAYTLFGRTRSAFGACRRRATRAFYADRMGFSSESPGHEVRLFYDCQGIGNL